MAGCGTSVNVYWS